ncbi:MAG: ribosomal-protein-alanine N-acetyltransferase [Paracoccaceae bacterium]|jgi:ribosomal-protein-alanine N-acetyltransferase
MLLPWRRQTLKIEGARIYLRPPVLSDHGQWARLRRGSAEFLQAWEPVWAADHLTRPAFRNRVTWANRMVHDGRGAPLFLFRTSDDQILGAITLDNMRRGPAQAATIGYWVGAPFARQGWMTEALTLLRDHAFESMGLSRLEAACLPENAPSRALLARCGFVHEGMATAFLSINGRWRDHALFAALRSDRLDTRTERADPAPLHRFSTQAPGPV